MLNEVIQKKIEELPHHIRKAIENFDWATEIMHIARNNKMQFDDIDTFKKETLMVMVGLTSAVDFEKNLVKQLGISHSFAEKLVDDANEFIFSPLQKIAFSHNTKTETEEIHHDAISKILNDHGIELIDETEEREKPKTKLQKIANSLFKEEDIIKKQTLNKEKLIQKITKENNLPEINKIPHSSNDIKTKKTEILHREPIREEDLLGIKGDRINTDILHKKNTIDKKVLIEKNHSMDFNNFKNTHISKIEKFDFSPSKEKQLAERGDFLKHIGAK